MNQPPLNPDALEASAKAMYNAEPWQKSTYSVESYSWAEIQEEDRQAFREEAEVAVSAYLASTLPEVTSVEEADNLPVGSVILLRNGTARLRTDWSSGWASAKAGDDYPTDDKGCFPARVLYRPEVKP